MSADVSNLIGAHSEKAESRMTRRVVDSGGIGYSGSATGTSTQICVLSESAEMYTSRCGATRTYIIFSKKRTAVIILAENVRRSTFPDLLLM